MARFVPSSKPTYLPAFVSLLRELAALNNGDVPFNQALLTQQLCLDEGQKVFRTGQTRHLKIGFANS
jgi:hypothetical protein